MLLQLWVVATQELYGCTRLSRMNGDYVRASILAFLLCAVSTDLVRFCTRLGQEWRDEVSPHQARLTLPPMRSLLRGAISGYHRIYAL